MILAHCSSGFKQSLNELLNNKEMKSQITNMHCMQEATHLDKFFETLRTQDGKVSYGLKSTLYALENQAIDTLLISDHLFRSKSNATRKLYVDLAEKAERNHGIKVVIFSSMSPAGQRLKDLTGIAAILFFALPGLDDVEEDDYHSSSEEEKTDESEEEKGGKSQSSEQSFQEEQMEMLMNEGMIGYEDELD